MGCILFMPVDQIPVTDGIYGDIGINEIPIGKSEIRRTWLVLIIKTIKPLASKSIIYYSV